MGVFVEVGVFVQMGSLVQKRRLVEQVSLVEERVSPQRAHSAVTQNGLRGRFSDCVHVQTDGGSGHDGGLKTDAQTPEDELRMAPGQHEEGASAHLNLPEELRLAAGLQILQSLTPETVLGIQQDPVRLLAKKPSGQQVKASSEETLELCYFSQMTRFGTSALIFSRLAAILIISLT